MTYLIDSSAKVLKQNLDEIVHSITTLIQDSHHRVQYSGFEALAHAAIEFSGKLQKKFHGQIMPILLNAFTNRTPNDDRVVIHALDALINFCNKDSCPLQAILTYLDELMQVLLDLLQNRFVLNIFPLR